MTLLDQRVVELIDEYVDNRLVIHWETVQGFMFIYRTKRDLTHRGKPTGGYVSFFIEMKPGRYEWSISLPDDEPTYTWITENDMGWKWQGGGAYIAICPRNSNEQDWSEIEGMMTMYTDFVERQDNCHYFKGLLYICQ